VSYTVPPAAGPARPRPASVTAASYLLYLVAALQLIAAVIALSILGPTQDAYRTAYQDFPELRGAADAIGTVGIAIGVTVAVLFAVGFVVLGILDGKGKNPARIVTWVVAGLGVCCSGIGVAGQAGSSALAGMGGGGNTNGPDPAEVQRIVDEALPSWYNPASITINALMLLALIAVIVLLALPAANAYFRKPEPTWEQPPPPYPPVS
jgi:hypothetical protein